MLATGGTGQNAQGLGAQAGTSPASRAEPAERSQGLGARMGKGLCNRDLKQLSSDPGEGEPANRMLRLS